MPQLKTPHDGYLNQHDPPPPARYGERAARHVLSIITHEPDETARITHQLDLFAVWRA